MCTLKGLHMYLAHHILSVLFSYYIPGNNITAEKNHNRSKCKRECLWSIQSWKEYQQHTLPPPRKLREHRGRRDGNAVRWRNCGGPREKVCFANDSTSELTRETAEFVIPYIRSTSGQHWKNWGATDSRQLMEKRKSTFFKVMAAWLINHALVEGSTLTGIWAGQVAFSGLRKNKISKRK